MIKVEKIDKYFNRFKKNQIHVIDNTSLEFENNGLVALLGPSGSGKTTLLNVIGGLDKVRRGNIYINGKKITNRLQKTVDKVRNLNIGYIFQDYKLVDNLSVYENVSLALKMIGIKDKKEIDKRVCYVLEKVGMLRYKKRPCNMLSGGERQRVGIARAIAKNPNIIIADEPTGNLDSKNSIEIMNIIKAISKDKLVILVTHEANLAKFYASRIIELEDGKIIKDYKNSNKSALDYEIGNTFYLKDYKYNNDYNGIKVYSNVCEKIRLNIVVSDNNIYIKSLDDKNIEVLDNDSSIEMVDDNFKNITINDIDKYEFDFSKITSKHKLRYSSIFNPITFITNGYKKVLSYSLLKKILLIGFFLSGIFIMYAGSSILASTTIKDEDFVSINKNYAIIESKNIKVDYYNELEKNLDADYIIPTNSVVKLNLKYDLFYQNIRYNIPITASLSSIDTITEKDIIMGRMPENDNEVALDELTIKNSIKEEITRMTGLSKVKDFLDKKIIINNMEDLKIVGIVSKKSPSIYTSNNKFINILYYSQNNNNNQDYYYEDDIETIKEYHDYTLFKEKITLKEGKMPENDYEVIVDIYHKEDMKLNKEISKKINNHKLKVVGYYTSKDNYDYYLVNNNMIKYEVIESSSNISVYTNDKDSVINKSREVFNLNIKDSYTSSKKQYIKEHKENMTSSIIRSLIILAISLIEILLMIRSSFLSRIKEVGIYRAIGVKKKDIYIMFIGEIFAITTLSSVPGILICSYIIKQLSNLPYINELVSINGMLIIVCILFVFIFNILVGLLPVFKTIRKRPAEILSRIDV